MHWSRTTTCEIEELPSNQTEPLSTFFFSLSWLLTPSSAPFIEAKSFKLKGYKRERLSDVNFYKNNVTVLVTKIKSESVLSCHLHNFQQKSSIQCFSVKQSSVD